MAMLNNQRVIALKDICSSVHPYFCRKPVELSYVLDSLGEFSDNIYIIREHIDAVQHFLAGFSVFFSLPEKKTWDKFHIAAIRQLPVFHVAGIDFGAWSVPQTYGAIRCRQEI